MFQLAAVNSAARTPIGDDPLQFDARLICQLVADHADLNTRVAALDFDPELKQQSVRKCAMRLVELRRIESLRVYPLIARSIEGDADAQRQFLQLRLLMLRLARCFQRRCEELSRDIALGDNIRVATDKLAEALAEYRRHNETEIYPLYELVGMRRVAA
jgi:hypothetical protein